MRAQLLLLPCCVERCARTFVNSCSVIVVPNVFAAIGSRLKPSTDWCNANVVQIRCKRINKEEDIFYSACPSSYRSTIYFLIVLIHVISLQTFLLLDIIDSFLALGIRQVACRRNIMQELLDSPHIAVGMLVPKCYVLLGSCMEETDLWIS